MTLLAVCGKFRRNRYLISLNQAKMTKSGTDAKGVNKNRELVDTLRRSKLFRSYEQVFSEATGLPLALRPVDYWRLEHQGKKNENPFLRDAS